MAHFRQPHPCQTNHDVKLVRAMEMIATNRKNLE